MLKGTDGIICYGGRDQCREMRSIVQDLGLDYCLIVDDTSDIVSPFQDLKLVHGIYELKRELSEGKLHCKKFMIAIANPYGFVRVRIANQLKNLGLVPVNICAKTAIIDKTAQLGTGVQVMRQAIVCSFVQMGNQVIINTKASIDHDCILEDGVEIAPGVILCGRVTVKKYSWICAGATVGPRVTIGENSIIGAGATVLSDVPPNSVYVGTPARFVKENKLIPKNIKNHLEESYE